MKRVSVKSALLIPAAVALALSAGACGSDSDGGAAPSSSGHATHTTSGSRPNSSRTLTAAQLKTITAQVKCMRAKGYEMPDPDPTNPVTAPKNVGGKDPAQVNKDATECAQQAKQSSGG